MVMRRLSIELFPEQHKKIKVLASLEGKTIKEYVLEKILGNNETQQMNGTTLEALNDIETETNLNTYDSVSDLFKKFE